MDYILLTILLTKGTGATASTLTTQLCGYNIEGGRPGEKKAIKEVLDTLAILTLSRKASVCKKLTSNYLNL